MNYYPKEDLGCGYFAPVASEAVHDTFMPIIRQHPRVVGIDMHVCNLMDHFRDDKPSGYGMAECYLVGPKEGQNTMLFVYGGKDKVVPVTVETNFFQGDMSLAALSIAVQILWYNQLCWKANDEGKDKLARWANDCYYALKDVMYLKELGLSGKDQAAVTGFLD